MKKDYTDEERKNNRIEHVIYFVIGGILSVLLGILILYVAISLQPTALIREVMGN